jgi:hypothetical protein
MRRLFAFLLRDRAHSSDDLVSFGLLYRLRRAGL